MLSERWVNYNGMQVGRVLVRETEPGFTENVYITERKKMFNLDGARGFSISTGVLDQVKKMNTDKVIVHLRDDGYVIGVFVVSLRKWLQTGKENMYGSTDKQLFLPINSFDIQTGSALGDA